MGTELSVLHRLRPFSIGFDSLFDHLESVLQYEEPYKSWPPYNIVKTDDTHFVVEIAVAGFTKEDISVSVDGGKLIVATQSDSDTHDDRKLVHRGIAKRRFRKTFTLADNVEVVSASMADGLLSITVEKVIPESQQPLEIEIL